MQSYQRHYSYQNRGGRLPSPKQPRPRRLLLKILLIFVIIFGLFWIAKSIFSNNQDTNTSEASAEVVKKPEKREVDTSNLAGSLSSITKQYPYNTSVAVVDLNSGTLVQTGDTYPFIAASTTKILTALVFLSEVEAGKESMNAKIGDKTAKAQLEAMVNESDNPAWKLLNQELTENSLLEYAKKHDMTSYDASDNKVTSIDMAKLVAKLYNRELINEEHTKLLLSWMQNTSEERFIPAAVPKELTVYHKAGYLPDRVHDVAIIDNGSAPFVLVIYSKAYADNYDYIRGQKLYRQITEAVIDTFK